MGSCGKRKKSIFVFSTDEQTHGKVRRVHSFPKQREKFGRSGIKNKEGEQVGLPYGPGECPSDREKKRQTGPRRFKIALV